MCLGRVLTCTWTCICVFTRAREKGVGRACIILRFYALLSMFAGYGGKALFVKGISFYLCFAFCAEWQLILSISQWDKRSRKTTNNYFLVILSLACFNRKTREEAHCWLQFSAKQLLMSSHSDEISMYNKHLLQIEYSYWHLIFLSWS